MREIKFRAWNDISKEMLYHGKDIQGLIWWNEFGEIQSLAKAELMQSTGLKDKNGKEIYEGDIFEYEYVLGEGYKYKTTDNPEMFNGVDVVGFANSEFIGENRYLMLSRYVNIKVIGNKFDNPELLEEDNNE